MKVTKGSVSKTETLKDKLDKKDLNDLVSAVNLLENRTNENPEHHDSIISALNLLDDRSLTNESDHDSLISAVNVLSDTKADKVSITSPDATDLATAITLLNEIKSKLNQ